jgi:[ribosomal protein S5]-alanine N-acetyltransferase
MRETAKLAPTLLTTARLLLRPTRASDADRAFDIQSDWDVARMLRMARFPPDREEIRRWFVDHQREWRAGEAYRFAVERTGKLIGLVDIDEISAGWGDLGYWFERAAWGRGYASEAAQPVVRFAFEGPGLSGLRSGHAADNAASRSVLLKLGFREVDAVQIRSRSRGMKIMQHRYALHRPLRN